MQRKYSPIKRHLLYIISLYIIAPFLDSGPEVYIVLLMPITIFLLNVRVVTFTENEILVNKIIGKRYRFRTLEIRNIEIEKTLARGYHYFLIIDDYKFCINEFDISALEEEIDKLQVRESL